MNKRTETYILPNTISVGYALHTIEKTFIGASILTDGDTNNPESPYCEITIIAYEGSFPTIERILAPYV